MHGQILVLESDVGNFQHVLARADFGKGEIALCRGGRARRLRAVGQGEQLHGGLYRRLLGVLHDTARYRNVLVCENADSVVVNSNAIPVIIFFMCLFF